MNIEEVQIAYHEDWPKIHLASIKTAYGKTAYSDEVIAGLEQVLHSRPKTLWDLNYKGMQYVTSLIGGVWKLDFTEAYIHTYPTPVVDLRAGVPGGTSQIDVTEMPTYPQVLRMHHTYLPNLSILDALCHLGPETLRYIVRYAEKLYTKP